MRATTTITAYLLALTACSSAPPAKSDATTTADTTAQATLARVQAALADDAAALRPARFIVHLHSAYSKDACDGHGLGSGDVPDATCVAHLRAGLCASMLEAVFMTDHPSHMKDFPFEQLLYYDAGAGDTLLLDDKSRPYANVLHCAAQGALPAHEVTLTVGYEATHTMPVAMHGHLPSKDLYNLSLSDSEALGAVQGVVQAIHDLGGLVVNAHSEQSDVTAQRLVDAGVDAMELYNIHANVFAAFLAHPENLFRMDPWLAPAGQAAHPDLAILGTLPDFPEPAFAKWQEVLRSRKITGLVGSDAHENVVFPALCGAGGIMDELCQQNAQSAPNAVAAFSKADSPVILADGVRFDSYTRMLRWYSNRALLPTNAAQGMPAIEAAMARGAVYTVWNVFGEPVGLQFVALAASGKAAARLGGIGDQVATSAASPVLLALRMPQVQAEPWSPFASVDAQTTPREVRVWRITAEGATQLATWDGKTPSDGLHMGGDGIAWLQAPGPGRYHLEVRIQPLHLQGALKAAAPFAQGWYRWAVSNVIEVQ